MSPNEVEAILIGPIAIGALITSLLSFIKKFVNPNITSDQIQLIKGGLTAGLYVLWMYVTSNKENAGVIISILMVVNIFLSSSGVYDTRYWLKSRIADTEQPKIQTAELSNNIIGASSVTSAKTTEITVEKYSPKTEGGTEYVPQRERGS